MDFMFSHVLRRYKFGLINNIKLYNLTNKISIIFHSYN